LSAGGIACESRIGRRKTAGRAPTNRIPEPPTPAKRPEAGFATVRPPALLGFSGTFFANDRWRAIEPCGPTIPSAERSWRRSKYARINPTSRSMMSSGAVPGAGPFDVRVRAIKSRRAGQRPSL
jgi:hypothetical protein